MTETEMITDLYNKVEKLEQINTIERARLAVLEEKVETLLVLITRFEQLLKPSTVPQMECEKNFEAIVTLSGRDNWVKEGLIGEDTLQKLKEDK